MAECEAAADLARRMLLSGVPGQELMLKGRGLTIVPTEVWEVGPQLGKLDLSDNPVSCCCCAEFVSVAVVRLVAGSMENKWQQGRVVGAALMFVIQMCRRPYLMHMM